MEPSWNLTSGPPRTTPEPTCAETPKISADGEKRPNKQNKKVSRAVFPILPPHAERSEDGGPDLGHSHGDPKKALKMMEARGRQQNWAGAINVWCGEGFCLFPPFSGGPLIFFLKKYIFRGGFHTWGGVHTGSWAKLFEFHTGGAMFQGEIEAAPVANACCPAFLDWSLQTRNN